MGFLNSLQKYSTVVCAAVQHCRSGSNNGTRNRQLLRSDNALQQPVKIWNATTVFYDEDNCRTLIWPVPVAGLFLHMHENEQWMEAGKVSKNITLTGRCYQPARCSRTFRIKVCLLLGFHYTMGDPGGKTILDNRIQIMELSSALGRRNQPWFAVSYQMKAAFSQLIRC
jgi:hypothetical protein